MVRTVRSGSRADVAVLGVCVGLALVATVLPDRPRDSIAGVLRSSVVAPIITLQASAERARAALVLRDRSTSRLDSLALRIAALEELEHENSRLRQLLGLGGALRWDFIPADALHERGAGEPHTLLVTAGARSGVVINAAVVAPEGLVGMVTTVDPSTSQAILWTHPDFRVSAVAAGTAFGIIAPHLGEGADRYLLELSGVAAREDLQPGTLVRSSGLGGVFPRGIPIGTVLREVQTSEIWSRTYLVRPAVLPADVSNVMVLLPRTPGTDVSAVWEAEARRDSARAALRRAADSLAARERPAGPPPVVPAVPDTLRPPP